MIFLTTGGNGAGKTLLTLKEIRTLQLAENRPVYYTERFKLIADFGWIPFKFEDWQSLPDGSICLCDEVHYDLPLRGSGKPPEYIAKLSEHRSRGFDFYLITQHPSNIDVFVRRLIASPGWHRHLKRAAGAPMVSQLKWSAVNTMCEKAGSGESAEVTMVPYPREVYAWYESTSLNTAKMKIPFQAKMLAGLVVALPILMYYAWQSFKQATPGLREQEQAGVVAGVGLKPPVQAVAGAPGAAPLTVKQYGESFAPRINGLSYTAPRYDALTTPTVAPYPAACLAMADRCKCYTQQATPLDVPADMCRQIVKGGIFLDWPAALDAHRRGEKPVADPPGV